MAAARAPRPHAAHRRWPLAERRRLVELTLRPGASARAIADEHGVHQNTLGVWKRRTSVEMWCRFIRLLVQAWRLCTLVTCGPKML